MNEDKIMSVEAFNEIIDCFEIVGSLTEYGRKSIKYHVKKLQQENKKLKEKLAASEKARKDAIELIKELYDNTDDTTCYDIDKEEKERLLQILDIDKGDMKDE